MVMLAILTATVAIAVLLLASFLVWRVDALGAQLEASEARLIAAIDSAADPRRELEDQATRKMDELEMKIRAEEPRDQYETRLRKGGARTDAEKADAETLK